MENFWNRENQLVLTLRRDLLVDFYDDYKNEPFFCEKGLVDYADNFIYNTENVSFNQILQSSTLLRDTNSTCRWVVCYFAEGLTSELDPGQQGPAESKIIYINGEECSISPNGAYSQQAPYWICCFPYDTYTLRYYTVDNVLITTQYNIEKSTAMIDALSKYFKGSNVLYDIQILPYCPLDRTIWDVSGTQVAARSGQPAKVQGTRGYNLLTVDNPDISFTLAYTYPYSLTNSEEYKIDSECRFIRLVSPNGSDVFQMNAAKNGGLNSFTVNMTCKPHSPFIQVKPTWGRLYGNQSYKFDKRGLIMTGNFSAPMTTDAWLDYQINNSTYKDSFDRQIENMETMHDIADKRLITQVALGTTTGAAQGAGAGFMVGGPVGAVVGGIAGGVTSAVGGIADYQFQQMEQREALSYAKDMFGFQMQNIKALPNGLSNIGSLDYSTATQPVIEVYSASNTEIAALKKKLTWNGFTIGRIGTVAEFKANADSVYTVIDTKYVKGQLIQGRNIKEDFHTINEISLELNKGVYFI